MILEYHRPDGIDEAIRLLLRKHPKTIPLAGGTTIQYQPEDLAVVDLQALGLNQIVSNGVSAELGSMVTFQQVMDWEDAPAILVEAVHRGATYNLRNQITMGGAVASNYSFSPLLAALLALDAKLTWQPREVIIQLGEWYPLRKSLHPGKLITAVGVPINLRTAMEIISRTPGDTPQIIACGCHWPSGRTRIVAMLKNHPPVLLSDGRDSTGVELSALNLVGTKSIFSGDYIENSLKILIDRVINRLQG